MLNDSDILTVPEVAAVLRVSKETVYKMVSANEIPFRRIRQQIRFLGWEIKEWLAMDKVVAAKKLAEREALAKRS